MRYAGLHVTDKAGRELPARFETRTGDGALWIKVTDTGALYPITIDPWVQSAKLFASDRQTNDYLGCSVALSSNGLICAAGAYGSSPGGTNDAGTAYVFTNSLSAPNYSVLGTNGVAIASGEAASAAKGTDFGSLSLGSARTNTLSITNSSSTTLSISGVTTNGSGAAYFRIAGIPAAVAGGTKSNFNVIYVPGAVGTHTAAVNIANNSTTTSYIVYLAGTCVKQSQTITFQTISDQVVSNIVGLRATASSGLAVSFAVGSGPATISGNVATFSATGRVSASQAGDANRAAAPNVTHTFNVLPLARISHKASRPKAAKPCEKCGLNLLTPLSPIVAPQANEGGFPCPPQTMREKQS